MQWEEHALTTHQFNKVRAGMDYVSSPHRRIVSLKSAARTLVSSYKSGFLAMANLYYRRDQLSQIRLTVMAKTNLLVLEKNYRVFSLPESALDFKGFLKFSKSMVARIQIVSII